MNFHCFSVAVLDFLLFQIDPACISPMLFYIIFYFYYATNVYGYIEITHYLSN